MNQESKRFFQFQQRFSIRKFKVGVASVAISTMAIASTVVMGQLPTVHAEEFTRIGNGTGNSVVADTQEFVMVTHEKPGGVVEDVAILKSNFSANLEQLKKEYPGFTATSLQSIGNNKYKITYVPVAATNRVQQQNLQLIQERLVLQIVHQQLLIKHKQQLKIELVYKDI